MLMSRKSDTHSHLARRIGKQKQSGLHTVTPAVRNSEERRAAVDPNGEHPFGAIQFDNKPAESKPGYKSILGL